MPRSCENWLNDYLLFTSDSEAPELFHFWTGVSTIAAVLQRKVWNEQRYFQWTPNFYVVFVAPPGIATKSTTIRLGTRLLENIPGVHFGPNSMTWQALTEALGEAHVIVDINGTGHPMSCLTCNVNELGTFLKPDDGELVDVLVDLWDGQENVWRRRTVGRGEETIPNPWINVIAATTPSWLRMNFSEAMIGGGLTSRIVFVYADHKRHLRAYPADSISEKQFKSVEKRLIADLHHISELAGEYHLTPDAKAWGVAWYEKHWSRRPDHMASERFGGYIARKQSHIHKLGIVLAASKRDELIITQDDLEISNDMMTGLEMDMNKVFESIGVADSARNVGEILALIRGFGELDRKTLWRHCINIMSGREFDESIDAAVKAGFIRLAHIEGGTMYYPIHEE